MRRLGVLLAVAAMVLGVASVALAHPLGNASVNHHVGVRVTPDVIELTHLVDLAEIPAFQALRQVDTDNDGEPTAAELATWAGAECTRRLGVVRVEVSGDPVDLTPVSVSAETVPGEAGLSILRLTCTA
ncbi:MAG: nickel transporter, partial [Acidimicrobiia bacterium]|nr:nickel transporter [Acidimicrobiia bacterium]